MKRVIYRSIKFVRFSYDISLDFDDEDENREN